MLGEMIGLRDAHRAINFVVARQAGPVPGACQEAPSAVACAAGPGPHCGYPPGCTVGGAAASGDASGDAPAVAAAAFARAAARPCS